MNQKVSKALWALAGLELVCLAGWTVVIFRTGPEKISIDEGLPPVSVRPNSDSQNVGTARVQANTTTSTSRPVLTVVSAPEAVTDLTIVDENVVGYRWENTGASIGEEAEIGLWISEEIYPAYKTGVTFWVNGRRDRTDFKGWKENDHFHATMRVIELNDTYEAQWMDSNGVSYKLWVTLTGQTN